MAACRPAENPELVLHGDHVHVADVDEFRRVLVGRKTLDIYFETDDAGIFAAFLDIIDQYREAVGLGLRNNRY